MPLWLIEKTAEHDLTKAMHAGPVPTPEQISAVELKAAAYIEEEYTVTGSTAIIPIKGVLTDRPSYYARYYGGGNTTYPSIIAAVSKAQLDPNVSDITYDVDSPGGSIDGLFDAIDAMQAVTKPTKALVSNVSASAAFALTAQADEVIARNRATRFGSVGIVAEFTVWKNDVSVTSTEAPNKRPDVTTEEGKAAVRAELDPIHDLFVDAIATGRGTTKETVNANYGRGGTYIAADAISKGMADGILGAVQNIQTKAAVKGGENKGGKMDLEQLKAEHPALYAQVVGIGAAQGSKKERERVSAHLTMAEVSGDYGTATKAIEDGEGMTDLISAKHQAAALKKRLGADMLGDNPDTPDPGAGGGQEASFEDKVVAMTVNQMGAEEGDVIVW